jgi:hypothetical protein
MALPLLTAHPLPYDLLKPGVRDEIAGLTATSVSG